MDKIKIILDTDIGTDIDDALALAYLLMKPECELMGITTVTGEAKTRAKLASVICKAANRGDIPIYPGNEECILIEQKEKFSRLSLRFLKDGSTKKNFLKIRHYHLCRERSGKIREKLY